jgi:hypothetical protein
MAADLRIREFSTDPSRPEGGDPIVFVAECVNVGDEGSGPISVRFEIDKAEYRDFHLDTIAAGASEWVAWNHEGMSQGDHFVWCKVDFDNEVAEPEEDKNSKSLYFKVHEIEFAPVDARQGEANFNKREMAKELIRETNERVNLWLQFALRATTEWGKEAQKFVVAEYADVDATFDTIPVLFAFTQAVAQHLPGMSTAMGVIEDIHELGNLVNGAMGDKHMTLPDARAKLIEAISEIQTATGDGLQAAVEGYDKRIEGRLTDSNPDSPVHQIEYGSDEPTYIGSLVDWLGVPAPTTANTTEPIKKEMSEAFEKVTWEVNRQLQKAAGI